MNGITTIGNTAWSDSDMRDKLESFAALYDKRPIKNNRGGMKSPHMFLTWFILQALKPKAIIESGVWLGQGTWLIENACPDAELFCIDPNLDRIQYRSDRAKYYDRDFSTIDWNHLDKEQTVLFFDDHQNAYERVKTAKRLNFRHLVFEDNYPPGQGDCYSLKMAFMHSGFAPAFGRSFKDKIRGWAKKALRQEASIVPPNTVDAEYLKKNLESYCELPPVFKLERTRWGDAWSDPDYPTPKPLLTAEEEQYQRVFLEDAASYTWMCYARLR